MWVFWPKEGHAEAFETATKTHLAWRKQAGETFVWEGYQPVLGTDLAHYVFRSPDHGWADFDAHQAWSTKAKADEAFAKDILPHVARYEHTMAEEDYEHSSGRTAIQLFWVPPIIETWRGRSHVRRRHYPTGLVRGCRLVAVSRTLVRGSPHSRLPPRQLRRWMNRNLASCRRTKVGQRRSSAAACTSSAEHRRSH